MEQTAFLERAINDYGKATYNYAYRLTQNEADARDLTPAQTKLNRYVDHQ